MGALLFEESVTERNVADNRRRKVAVLRVDLSTNYNLALRIIQVALQPIQGSGVHEPGIGVLGLRPIRVELFMLLLQRVHKRGLEGSGYQHVVRRNASLPSVENLTPVQPLGGELEVASGVDEYRRLAAQFQGDRGKVLCRSCCNDPADPSASSVEDWREVGLVGTISYECRWIAAHYDPSEAPEL